MIDRLGIVGFGAFGRFMSGHLASHALEIVAFDPSGLADASGVCEGSIADVARCESIVLAVPLSAMRGVLVELAHHLADSRAGAPLVADVCSVKVEPLRLMREILPARVGILGTHPLFGPQSGAAGIAGLPIAVCPVRVDDSALARARGLLEVGLGLRVIEVDPERHDREMAYVQGLTHYISRALAAMPLPESELATVAYQRLLAMRSNLASDSWALFETIQRGNQHAADVRAALRLQLEMIEVRLGRRHHLDSAI